MGLVAVLPPLQKHLPTALPRPPGCMLLLLPLLLVVRLLLLHLRVRPCLHICLWWQGMGLIDQRCIDLAGCPISLNLPTVISSPPLQQGPQALSVRPSGP